ncbi:MAG: ATP-binding cassette domain-containing protein, partial [Pseudomonadota bacterium]
MAEILLEHVSVDYPVKRLRSATLMRAVKSLATGGELRQDRSSLSVQAVRDLTLRLTDGDRLGILGHNGAGKTTLLRVLAGILPVAKDLTARIRVAL